MSSWIWGLPFVVFFCPSLNYGPLSLDPRIRTSAQCDSMKKGCHQREVTSWGLCLLKGISVPITEALVVPPWKDPATGTHLQKREQPLPDARSGGPWSWTSQSLELSVKLCCPCSGQALSSPQTQKKAQQQRASILPGNLVPRPLRSKSTATRVEEGVYKLVKDPVSVKRWGIEMGTLGSMGLTESMKPKKTEGVGFGRCSFKSCYHWCYL